MIAGSYKSSMYLPDFCGMVVQARIKGGYSPGSSYSRQILYKLFYDSFTVKRSKNAIISQQRLPKIVKYNLPQNYNAYTTMSNSLANLKKQKKFFNKNKLTIF